MFRPAIVLLALAAAVAGCADEERQKPASQVRLSIDGPGDGAVVRDDVVSVRGKVRPRRAVVEVAGRRASVVDGRFAVDVPVRSGANVLDVAATAPGARAAVAGLRIVREDRVTLPDLVGMSPDDAALRLQDLGLEARLREDGGFLDAVVPGEPQVCRTSPESGARVLPGTTVTVVAARLC